jgi:hypothetical protein
MGLLSFFTPKTQADKNLAINPRAKIITDPRRTGITPEYVAPVAHISPRELFSLVEFEVQKPTVGIHVEYDSKALDYEWEELMRQSTKKAAVPGIPVVKATEAVLELVPLDEIKPFERGPTRRARHELQNY